MSFWAHIQLRLIRALSIVLGLVDRLFNSHWGEHLLARMARRWETQLGQLDEAMDALHRERERLHQQAEALSVQAAAIYLSGRTLSRGELRFDPADPRDEELLDASIELLVKDRLAAIEAKEIQPGHYLYWLEPDWAAIHARLASAAAQSEPEVAEWLREGLRLIDEVRLQH
jgi:hypothetical protein